MTICTVQVNRNPEAHAQRRGGVRMANIMNRPQTSVSNEIDRMFSDFFGFPGLRADMDVEFMPRVNIKETKDNVMLQFEIPGMEKKDVKVTVKDNNLIVSGQREFRQDDENENFIRHEIRTGRFSRSFTLPETLDQSSCKADYKNGILEIKFNKREEVKPKEIDINVE